MMKKALSLVLALAVCLGLTIPAFAAPGDFDIKNGVLERYNGPGGDVTIPDGVTQIAGYAFYNQKGLTSVTIPDSVTYIGQWAFANCKNLTGVIIPDSVTEIGGYTFFNCGSLTSVSIPDSVTEIGWWAFGDCGSLTSVTIPDSVTRIGQAAFTRCYGLTSVDIPDSITQIDREVFSGCSGLTSVTIPASVTRIDRSAFANCARLVSVTIPASVTEIGWWAFGGCTSLTDIYYGGSAAQWQAVTVDNSESGNRYLLDAGIHCGNVALASTQTVTVDGKAVEFQMYALLDANGNPTNYIKLRDMAYVLNGTKAQFAVDYDGTISLTTKKPYAAGGSEMTTPYSGNRACKGGAQGVKVNGANVNMTAITLTDDNGGDYNYFKLRDLGKALNFYVGWSAERGMYIETDKGYTE